MSKRSILAAVAALAMVFGASGAMAQNSLDVNANAALGGSLFGLEVLLDGGSTNGVYVAENAQHNDETVYRAEWRVNHNNIAMDEGSSHNIFLARQVTPTRNNLRVSLFVASGDYKIGYRAKKEGAGTAFCGKFTISAAGGGARAGIEVVPASGTGMSDGVCRLFKNGVEQFERTDVSNFGTEVDAVRFGAPKGSDIDATTVGSFYLDDFQSFRTLAP